MIDDLRKLIEQSERLLITSHIGPDGDCVSSSILLYEILRTNYPDKSVVVSMEEAASNLSFIGGYDEIKFQTLENAVSELKPELLIILDANGLRRVTRDPETARAALEANNTKLAIIDHHEPEGRDTSEVYINQMSPAIAQDIYDIFISQLGLKKPEGYAQIAIVGIYTDTGGFTYRNRDYRKTFKIVSELLDDGADIESVVNQLSHISDAAFDLLSQLMKNTADYKGGSFTFVADEYTDQDDDEIKETLREAVDFYRSFFLRNRDGRPWGFIIYRDLLAPRRTYSVSFRAQSDTVDVSKIAVALGGGGHKPAAAAKIECGSAEEALEKVKAAIDSLN